MYLSRDTMIIKEYIYVKLYRISTMPNLQTNCRDIQHQNRTHPKTTHSYVLDKPTLHVF